MEDIPPYQPRPFRFSLKLAGLCFGCSFILHAAIVLGMLSIDVPPASPWSSKAKAVPEGDRHVVSVTFTMKMTDFANAPAFTRPAEDDRPLETVPPDPPAAVADPAVTTEQGGSSSTVPPTDVPPLQPVPETPTQKETILQDLLATPRPVAKRDQTRGPLTPPAELIDQRETIPPRLAVSELADNLIVPRLPNYTEQLEREIEDHQTPDPKPDQTPQEDRPAQPTADEATPPDGPPAKETPPSTNGSEQDTPQTKDTTDTDEQEEDDRPAAMVYDEKSVDQPIAFDKMARPKLPAVSKRLGETGTVRILVEVDEQGRLIRQTVIDETKYPRLLAAALAALERSTFLPAEHEGEPVRSTRIIEYRF
ncbi:MAG: TonB family protein [Planctomycetota bacterium]